MTGQKIFIDYAHHEVHAGSHFNLSYSVASIGALAAPDDMMTLSFRTPAGKKCLHFIFSAICSSGARLRFIEGKTGGGTSPTGTIQSYNSNRSKKNVSIITDVAGANAGKVSYDATLFTGGDSLVDEIIGVDGQGKTFAAGSARSEQEWVLAPDTLYQLSLYLNDSKPGTIQASWYEHTTLQN